ncbi:MAG TPA: LuxR C-terminal-related transcriptional regulator [Chloroflexota bacterium]|nr:LuxR C-terminal-related transcriptional regulator [Chloroflexota bacterium]
MSGTSELSAREALHRELLEHEQRLRQFIGQAFGEGSPGKTGRPARPVLAASLTPRDLEILSLLVLGQTNRQIGMQVRLGPGTVRNHLSRIFRKLGVNSRTEAAVRALELGLVRADNAQ